MYISIFLVICFCTLMFRVAQMEKRSGTVWAGITLLCIAALTPLISKPFLVALLGTVVAFMIMTLANIYKPVPRDMALRRENNPGEPE